MWQFALAFLVSSPAVAEGANGSREIGNLDYYPHPQVLLISSVLETSVDEQTINSPPPNSATTFASVALSAVYGVRPGLRIGLAETLLWDKVQDAGPSTIGSGQASATAGFANPVVTTAWRFAQEEQSGFATDLSISLSPSLRPKQAPNPSLATVGSSGSGASAVGIELVEFWERGENELALGAAATRNFLGQTNGSTPSTTYQTLPFWESSLRLADRYHLGPRFFAELGATYYFRNVATLNVANGNQRTVASAGYLESQGHLGWQPEPHNELELGVAMHHSTLTSSTVATGNKSTAESRFVRASLTFLHEFGGGAVHENH